MMVEEEKKAEGLVWFSEVINSQARIRAGLHLRYLILKLVQFTL